MIRSRAPFKVPALLPLLLLALVRCSCGALTATTSTTYNLTTDSEDVCWAESQNLLVLELMFGPGLLQWIGCCVGTYMACILCTQSWRCSTSATPQQLRALGARCWDGTPSSRPQMNTTTAAPGRVSHAVTLQTAQESQLCKHLTVKGFVAWMRAHACSGPRTGTSAGLRQ